MVADRIPSYEPFAPAMQFGDWQGALRHYRDEPDVARAHVELGRSIALARFNDERITGLWERFLGQALL